MWLLIECMVSRAKTALGKNREAPEQDAGRAGLMGCSALGASKCPLLHACPFLNSTVSALSITEQHLPSILLDFWSQEVKLGDGIGGSKDHSFSCERTGGDSVHAVSPEYLVDEIAAQRQQVNGCARSHGVRTHLKE